MHVRVPPPAFEKFVRSRGIERADLPLYGSSGTDPDGRLPHEKRRRDGLSVVEGGDRLLAAA